MMASSSPSRPASNMDWPVALRVLAHEMRSPSTVISGYARMLREGRLDEAHRVRASAQIEKAAGQLGTLSRQVSDLVRWIACDPLMAEHAIDVMHLAEGAAGQAAVAGSGQACSRRARLDRALSLANVAISG